MLSSQRPRIIGARPLAVMLLASVLAAAPLAFPARADTRPNDSPAFADEGGSEAAAEAALSPIPAPKPAVAVGPAAPQFAAVEGPADGPPRAIGSYSRGCVIGAAALPTDGLTFQAMRLSRNRRWGHPVLIDFVTELVGMAPRLGLAGLLVGDLSQPRGGPMPTGHVSHQIGLDVDIWLTEMPRPRLTVAARETAPFVSVLREPGGVAVDPDRFAPFRPLLRHVARDERVARVFVNRAIKRALCQWADEQPEESRAWLSRIRPWHGHDAHFHVRLNCPGDAPSCVDQAAPPEGDGCGAPLTAWFEPPPAPPSPGVRARPRQPLTLAQLPPACRALVTREGGR